MTNETSDTETADASLAGDATVAFESDTEQAFRQLVQETIDQSEFIETEWVGDHLVLHEA